MLRAALLVAALLLAGCSQADAPADGDAVGVDGQALQATADTAVLSCVVVDPAIVPIEGAMVIIQGQVMHTDAEGRCGADGLRPGPVVITASKRGFQATQTTVELVAGEATETIRIQLGLDPDAAIYTQQIKHDAHIACSTTWSSACGHALLSEYAEDSSTLRIVLDDVPVMTTMEAIWTSTQPLGDELFLVYGAGEPLSSNAHDGAKGESPVMVRFGVPTGNELKLDQQSLFVRLFASEINGTPTICTPNVYHMCFNGVGVAVQQDVELFIHAFYGWTPGSGWAFHKDGEPVPPQ